MSAVEDMITGMLATADQINAALDRASKSYPRHVLGTVSCAHETPNPDSMAGQACGWSGLTVVTVWEFPTKEALWWCPAGHENSEPWTDFA